jgi:hypothetical protein
MAWTVSSPPGGCCCSSCCGALVWPGGYPGTFTMHLSTGQVLTFTADTAQPNPDYGSNEITGCGNGYTDITLGFHCDGVGNWVVVGIATPPGGGVFFFGEDTVDGSTHTITSCPPLVATGKINTPCGMYTYTIP